MSHLKQTWMVRMQTWMLSANLGILLSTTVHMLLKGTIITPTSKMGGSWQPIAEHKRAQREALIPKDCRLPALPSPNVINVTGVPRSCGLLSAQELDITENYDATALAQAISSGRLKCIDVTRAFCKASPHNAGKREIQRDRNANIRYAQRAAIAQQLVA